MDRRTVQRIEDLAHACHPSHECAICGQCTYLTGAPYRTNLNMYNPRTYYELPTPDSGSLAANEFRPLCELCFWSQAWIVFAYHGRKLPDPSWLTQEGKALFEERKRVGLLRLLSTIKEWG